MLGFGISELVLSIIASLIAGAITGIIARVKGRSYYRWLFYGMAITFIGVIISLYVHAPSNLIYVAMLIGPIVAICLKRQQKNSSETPSETK